MIRFWHNVKYALSGIVNAFRTERHLRFHTAAAIVVTVAGLMLQMTRFEWIILVLTMAMVIAAELVNSAVERVVDLASAERHPLAKAAKDMAAGAVLVTAIASVVIGLLLFGPHVWAVLSQ
ncbi:diacylglycerol kinase family protein [Paenibacillus sp. GCM10027626]|uniref:diacylglycerol kinase family protein n=1 Tax=Paenibacillus sp. GCM10027626 TaxID=3273411 RepID=UPI00363D64C1